MDHTPYRDLSSREADGLVMAIELVLSTSIFGFLGYLLDRGIGTVPVFTVAFATFTLGYTIWRMVTTYDTQMADHIGKRDPLRRGGLDG